MGGTLSSFKISPAEVGRRLVCCFAGREYTLGRAAQTQVRRLRRLLPWPLLLILLLAACDTGVVAPADNPDNPEDPGTPDPTGSDHTPVRIELSTASLTVWPSEGDTLRVRAFDAEGNEVPAPAVAWSSDNPVVASVDASGVVTGVAEGRSRVTATSDALSASVAVEVLGAELLEVEGPPALLVNEIAVLEVTAHAAAGQVIRNPPWATFSSSDASLLEVSAGGTVRGLRRGSGSITVRYAGASAVIALDVRARLVLNPSYLVVGFNVGETLRLSAVYEDVNGAEIPEKPVVSWRSNNPAVVAVTPDVLTGSDGLVTATTAAYARIYAATQEDTLFRDVAADDFRPGQATTIRYAHVMRGVGPITFVPGIGDPVTLSFGESTERPIAPGSHLIRTEGMPVGQPESVVAVDVRDGDRLSVYAMVVASGSPPRQLVAFWSRQHDVPAEWGIVRVAQGSAFLTYFLRPQGEAATGLPDECYFDGGNVHNTWGPLAPAAYDVILTTKYGFGGGGSPVELGRIPLEVPSGKAITAVLIGNSAADADVLTFVDP